MGQWDTIFLLIRERNKYKKDTNYFYLYVYMCGIFRVPLSHENKSDAV